MAAQVVQTAAEAPKVLISHEKRCRQSVVEVARVLRKTSSWKDYFS